LLAKSLPRAGFTEILGSRPDRFGPAGAGRARTWPVAGSGHGRLSDTPQDDVRIAVQRSHTLLSDTVRDLNKLDDG
jgi:hypothetical protein